MSARGALPFRVRTRVEVEPPFLLHPVHRVDLALILTMTPIRRRPDVAVAFAGGLSMLFPKGPASPGYMAWGRAMSNYRTAKYQSPPLDQLAFLCDRLGLLMGDFLNN